MMQPAPRLLHGSPSPAHVVRQRAQPSWDFTDHPKCQPVSQQVAPHANLIRQIRSSRAAGFSTMRLIRIGPKLEISLDPDLDHGSVPDYAILSHTWGLPVEELRFQDLREKAVLTFEDLRKSRPLSKPGIDKLIFCARQAHDDGIRHIWIDTCCINKFDKQENAKAVKDMFRWYQKAKKCYVYLSDVPKVAFAKSRWFTRGWTLQELLAPKTVEFFSCTGDYLGNKETLLDDLHRITGIPTEALGGQLPLSEFSVSERFGWGVRRVTTREEDQVYCLLGIFEVNLDMSLQGLDGAYANLLDAIDTSTQPHCKWSQALITPYSLLEPQGSRLWRRCRGR